MAKLQANLTPVSNEEYNAIMADVMAAMTSGDEDLYEQMLIHIPISPSQAMELKHSIGIEAMIADGLNLSRAVEAYGEDWLFRE
jgi:hypothetical protein